MRSMALHTSPDEGMDALVVQLAPQVKRIAYHLLNRLPASVQVDDLIQAGLLGLLEATRRYDPLQSANFGAFVKPRIRGAMIDEIRKGDWTPRSVHRKAREVMAATQAVEAATGCEAQDRDIAQQLGMTLAEYHATLADAHSQKLLSLDEIGTDDKGEVYYIPAPNSDPVDTIDRDSALKALAAAIDQLPEREKLVLSLYYNEELRLKDIGAVLGVSESRISQLHAQALARLRAQVADSLS